MKIAILVRLHANTMQTLGTLLIVEHTLKGDLVFTGHMYYTLELRWRLNQRNISCIPTGRYDLQLHSNKRLGLTYRLKDVPDRSGILIHKGNFYSQIRGCILVGKSLSDINADGYQDVTDSAEAMKELIDMKIKRIFISNITL